MTKKMIYKIVILLIGVVFNIYGNSFPVFATEIIEENLEENFEGNQEDSTKQEFYGGYIDIDDPLEFDVNSNASLAKEVLPASYDGRSNGRISSVKNQNPYGTCWAFSVMAAAETQLLMETNKEYDFSELQLIYFAFHHSDDVLGLLKGDSTTSSNYLGEGSTNLSTIFALSSWVGVGMEEDLPYSRIGDSSLTDIDAALAYKDTLHIDQAVGVGMKYNNNVKSLIMQYGAVVSGVHMPDGSTTTPIYNDETNSLYSLNTSANHSILVVGWDDTYSRDNFLESCRPGTDGAWLIKNSWGASKPYFWVSYEDACISKQNAFAYRFKEASLYDYNYQHDGSLSTHYENVENGSTLANVYEINGSDYEELKAISFAVRSNNVNYSIQVYKNSSKENPLDGEPLLTNPIVGTVSYAGFHTVEMGEEVLLEKGDCFTVAITLNTSGSEVSYYADASGGLYDKYGNKAVSFLNKTEEGQSFLCTNANVTDLSNAIPVGTSGNPNGIGYSARIKAYTKVYEKPAIDLNESTISSVATQIYNSTPLKPKVTVTYEGKTLVQNVDYKLTYANNTKIGTAKITITGIGAYVGSKTKTFKIVAKKNPTTIYNGVDYKYVYDYNYYVSKHYSLWTKYNNDDKKVLEYFVKTGMKKGHQAMDSFDVNSYANQYYDLRKVYKNDLPKYYLHYINHGKKEGRISNGITTMQGGPTSYQGTNYKYVFDVGFYADQYTDLQQSFGYDDALYLKHFVENGMKEARQGSAGFNVINYRKRYSDLRKAFGTDYKKYYLHYVNYGKKEGRNGK